MAANGFLQQKPASPVSLGAVLLLHGAVIGGVLFIKGPEWIRFNDPPIETYDVPPDRPPPPEIVDPPKPKTQEPAISRYDMPPQRVPTPSPTPTHASDPTPIRLSSTIGTATPPDAGTLARPPEKEISVPPQRMTPPPVRTDAQFDPRFLDAMQPPYPVTEERAEREGIVRLRVTISPAGRVIAAERLSATTDAFWRATERQALSRWRFKPATLDGRPVESSKVLSVRFRLDGR